MNEGCEGYDITIDSLYEDNMSLREENEKLKKEIEDLEDEIKQMQYYIDDIPST